MPDQSMPDQNLANSKRTHVRTMPAIDAFGLTKFRLIG